MDNKYSAKDQAIINNNPGVSPYDLHTKFGLSKKGFEQMQAEQDLTRETPGYLETKNESSKLQPSHTEASKGVLNKPTVSSYNGPSEKGRASLKNTKTGKITPMSRTQAERWAKKYPTEYQVL